MPAYRIGLGSDFNLNNQLVGIGTTTAGYKLTVANVLKGDFNITGVTTLTSYGGFVGQKQNISIASSVGFTTTGIGTVGITSFISTNEKDYGYISLIGEYNTVSEDIVVDEGRIFDISTITNIGITTLGTQSVYVPTSSVVNAGTLRSVSIGTHFSFPNGGIAARPEEPIEGTVRFNDDLNTLEFYNGVEWRQFTVDGSSGRGVFGGAYSTIQYINISSTGNASNFGTLSVSRTQLQSCSSSIRGLFAGGYLAPSSFYNVIDYITIASEGNAIDFGDLNISARRKNGGGCSSSTRGLLAGGFISTPTSTSYNNIDYVTIATIGNALDFGDLSIPRGFLGSCASPTRGIFAGGFSNPSPANLSWNIIEFVTISSTGNAVDFGDSIIMAHGKGGCSNSTRGIFAGGQKTPGGPYTKEIEYITIATTGNSLTFGDLTLDREYAASTASSTRGVFGGGDFPPNSPTGVNIIDYVTFATIGNAQDFGDLVNSVSTMTALSDSHGGLGGF